jgi:hypothetical protein
MAGNTQFRKPVNVKLRDAWPLEDKDFTPWLAGNLDYLSDLGLGSLSLLETEVSIPGVGRRLDILAETVDEQRIAIENQYRGLDHDHLTRGLAYAVGLEARALVLVAEEHLPEFAAVADYLNHAAEELGESGIPIFLVTVKVEQLDDYLIPRFEIVSKPNSWRAEISATSAALGLSAADKVRRVGRQTFWKDVLKKANDELGLQVFVNWTTTYGNSIWSAAVAGRRLNLGLRLRKDEAYPSLYIDDGPSEFNLAIFNNLKAHIDQIQEATGYELIWDDKPGKQAYELIGPSTIQCGWNTDVNIRDKNLGSLLNDYIKLRDALQPYVKIAVDQADSDQPGDD